MTAMLRDATGTARRMYLPDQLGDPNAPLPMTRSEAIDTAGQLATAGMAYRDIAIVMARYHGHHLTRGGWWAVVRKWCPDAPPINPLISEARRRQKRARAA